MRTRQRIGLCRGISGGVVFGLKDFWQRHPTALEINGPQATGQSDDVLWSPEAPAMDLRHYDDHSHGLEIQYEDVEPAIARRTASRHQRDFLWAVPATPSPRFDGIYRRSGAPARLVCSPERYHTLGMFWIVGAPRSLDAGESAPGGRAGPIARLLSERSRSPPVVRSGPTRCYAHV